MKHFEPVATAATPGRGIRVRTAVDADLAGIVAFGEEVVPAHYAPLIGAAAAQAQVDRWWDAGSIEVAVAAGLVVVAEADGRVVGVGQRGLIGGEHVIWKLYLHPAHRGRGVGPRLLGALVDQLPADAQRVWIEHLAANERAGAFYGREGFTVDRVEAGAAGQPATDLVWRVRLLGTPGRGGVTAEECRTP